MFIRKITILLAIIFVFLIPTRLMALYGNDNMNFKSQDNNHDFSLDINSRDNVFIDKFDTGPSAKTQANFVVTESLMTDISSDEYSDEYDDCKTPPEKTTFYDTDTRAALWFHYENANAGDTHKTEWYSPDGNLYAQGSGTYSYNNGCWLGSINIKGASAASKLGEWQVKVYRNNEHKFTETFTIVSDSVITPTPSPTPTPATCSDSYEPNDSSSQAYGYLSSGSSYSGKICSGSDVDWFKVNITSAGTISLSLTVPSSNDYELDLLDASDARVASSTNGSGVSESINYDATSTGNYYIKIYGFSSSNTTDSYTLTYTFTSTTSATPTPSPTPTSIATAIPSPSPTPTASTTPTPTASATPTRILLLLHEFGSNPKTWKKFVKDRVGSYSILDYEEGDVINSEPVLDKKGILCYAVKFGAWDTSSGRKNVEGETATESSSGDYFAIAGKKGRIE